jgi:hypothetical protein
MYGIRFLYWTGGVHLTPAFPRSFQYVFFLSNMSCFILHCQCRLVCRSPTNAYPSYTNHHYTPGPTTLQTAQAQAHPIAQHMQPQISPSNSGFPLNTSTTSSASSSRK